LVKAPSHQLLVSADACLNKPASDTMRIRDRLFDIGMIKTTAECPGYMITGLLHKSGVGHA